MKNTTCKNPGYLQIGPIFVIRKSGSLKAYKIHCLSVCFTCHPKTRRRQKLIGALKSARIGEGAKPKNIQNLFLKNW
jgi:hypothetical protein